MTHPIFRQLCFQAQEHDHWVGLSSSARNSGGGIGHIDGIQIWSSNSKPKQVAFSACTLATLDDTAAALLKHMGWEVTV